MVVVYTTLCSDPSTRHLDGLTLLWTGSNVGGREKNEGAKQSSKILDIVSYGLEISVDDITSVCSPFQVRKHI